MIQDSGERREFDSGAVRDISEGKGRCDLLPLDVVSFYFNRLIDSNNPKHEKATCVCSVINCLDKVLRQGKEEEDTAENYRNLIITAMNSFACAEYEYGSSTPILELAKHYEEGAKKYAERNWEKGIPAHCYVDSAIRHLLKWYDGWNDEPHNRAVLWNLAGLLWTLRNKPELNDLPGGY